MRLRMWTYDLAREQSPTLDNLRSILDLTQAAGYNAFGLYMEHRFAYPSTPWTHGAGVVTPEMVRTLIEEFPDIQIIPFLNLLGHMEGFLYTEYGRRYAEERFKGMQACPTNPDTMELANKLIDDVLDIFTAEIIHIGGDETQQLGACARCRSVGGNAPMREPGGNVEELMRAMRSDTGSAHQADQKSRIYARYFAPLARRVIDAGRRPAIWGDMLLEYPKAAVAIPRETLIFDWQYFHGPERSAKKLAAYDFEVVCCPSLQTYNAAWLHVDQSEQNVCDHVRTANEMDAYGVCVTTWENGLFGSYEALMPAIQACGKMLNDEPGQPSEPVVTPKFALFGQISYLYHGELEGVQDWTPADRPSEATTVANDLLSKVISDDVRSIRLEPTQKGIELHYEDGKKTTMVREFRAQVRDPLLNRMRLLAGLPVEGRRLAQRGFIAGRCAGVSFHFDVLTQPTDLGPRIMLTRKDAATTALGVSASASKDYILESYSLLSAEHKEWARLMGVELQSLGGAFAHSQIRSSLKVRLLLQGNPFLAWLHHGDEFSGDHGAQALKICDRAMQVARDPATRGVTGFIKSAVEFVRYAEQAHQAYANELPGVATSTLAPARQLFDDLEKIAKANHLRFGGSKADVERCKAAKLYVEKVMHRIKDYGDGSLGYLPSFEHITHPNFIPHDQGAWWLINKWAYE